MAPSTRFVLLTSMAGHDHLAELDAPNVSRLMVSATASGRRRDLKRWLRKHVAPIRRLSGPFPVFARELGKIMTGGAGPNPSVLKEIGADLLFCPFGLSTTFDCPNGVGERIPTVAILIDLQHRRYPQFFTPETIALRERSLARHRMSAVAVISDFVRESLVREGFDRRSVTTIYIRLDGRLPEVDLERIRVTLQSLHLVRQSYFLYPANFWQHKNHEVLLRAFAMARSMGLRDEVKLVCTGAPGSRMDEVVHVSDALGLREAVRFPGFCDDITFSALLGSSLAVVFPSLYEGFGMPVLEAMAAGCPVACSNATSLPEIAGDAALLFDPESPSAVAQAMCRLDSDPQLRSDLMEKGVRRAVEFADSDRMAREYWSLFERALA